MNSLFVDVASWVRHGASGRASSPATPGRQAALGREARRWLERQIALGLDMATTTSRIGLYTPATTEADRLIAREPFAS